MCVMNSPQFDAEKVKADFPILAKPVHGTKRLVYLDNAATTQKPRQVIEAIVEGYETYNANVHRGSHYLSDAATGKYEEARETVRRLLNATSANEIVFTSGCTAGVNLVARSWGDANLKHGDEILITEMEHHANVVPWQQLAARVGAKVRMLPIDDHGQLRLDLLDEYLSPRTKLFAFAAVSNVLGTINPIADLCRKAKSLGITTFIDAAQAAPHEPLDVQTIGCDFLAFSAHKLLGPTGIGALYGREELLETMPPFLGGGNMIRTVTPETFTTAMLPAKFEAGTPPIVEAFGLTAAIDYIEQLGLENIRAHEQRLAAAAHRGLEELKGIRFLGPSPDKKAGIVSFVVEGGHPSDVNMVLDHRGVAIRIGHHCTMPLHQRLGVQISNRASFYLYNTDEDVAQLVEAVRDAKKKLRLP